MSLPCEAALRTALRVARCEELDRARDVAGHPCHLIVGLQPDRRLTPEFFQVPEAWAGNIETAKIVFVSSNPSISEDGASHGAAAPEDYPRHCWDDARVGDFITRRFDPDAKWVRGDRFLCQDGTYAPKEVAFWSRVRKRARELVEDAAPERDYAMVEVVHCKSRNERGVRAAAPLCMERHFETVMQLSAAPLVVVLGARARDLLREPLGLGPRFGSMATVGIDEKANLAVRRLGGRERVVLYLGHPTGMIPGNTFVLRYPARLAELRALAKGEMSVRAFAPAARSSRPGPQLGDT